MDCDFGDGSQLRFAQDGLLLSAVAINRLTHGQSPITDRKSRIDQEADTCLSFLGPQTKADFYSRCHDIFSGRASSISNYWRKHHPITGFDELLPCKPLGFSQWHTRREIRTYDIHSCLVSYQVERVRHPRRLFDLFPP